MAVVSDATQAPRYGSAAELASYAGLSVKTIRRLVDAGKLQGRKVGRRLLIAFEDLDAHLRRPAAQGRPTAAPQATPDAQVLAPDQDLGPDSPTRAGALLALDELAEAGDEDEDEQAATFAALVEGLEAHRMSARGRFQE